MFNFRPAKCRHCRVEIVQPKTGRPRETCAAPACQREAEAERKRALRRKKAGLGGVYGIRTPQPKGGRDPLARRFARQFAAKRFPHVQVTPEEMEALEAAVRLGVSVYGLKLTPKGAVLGIPGDLERAERGIIRALVKRHHEATPRLLGAPITPGLLRAHQIVGELPEPFVRKGPRRSGGRSGWIDLPLPDEKRLIDI